MSNLDKMVTDKEHNLNAKLDRLSKNVKKLDNYIKENNNKKINTKKELDAVENERNNLLLKYNQSKQELMKTKNKLYETENKLDKAGDDIDEKTKHINE